ncbi:unnamed protein product [Moneuplotes crassus]|uniref:Uncharacterized protein n=1 Tax=Euplotes crassus TaxID=5936 RepID=A0AAD1UL21_EUPCR|nr:unnamed protein product [Moneuplotes crassus]
MSISSLNPQILNWLSSKGIDTNSGKKAKVIDQIIKRYFLDGKNESENFIKTRNKVLSNLKIFPKSLAPSMKSCSQYVHKNSLKIIEKLHKHIKSNVNKSFNDQQRCKNNAPRTQLTSIEREKRNDLSELDLIGLANNSNLSCKATNYLLPINDIEKSILKIASEVISSNNNDLFKNEEKLRRILTKENSSDIKKIFQDSVSIIKKYFQKHTTKIMTEMDALLKDSNNLSNRSRLKSVAFHNLSSNLILPSTVEPSCSSNSRNVPLLMESRSIYNQKSYSLCSNSLNSIHCSYRCSQGDSQQIKVPASLSKKPGVPCKAIKKLKDKSITGVSSLNSHNTSLSRKGNMRKKNKSLKICNKNNSEIMKKTKPGSHVKYHNISHMSSSSSFHKYFKSKRSSTQQVSKLKCERSSSEPAKEPKLSNNMIKIRRKNKREEKSAIYDPLQPIAPTPTVQFNLERSDMKQRKDSQSQGKTKIKEDFNNDNLLVEISNSSSVRKIPLENSAKESSQNYEANMNHSHKDISIQLNQRQNPEMELSGEYEDISHKFSQISPIPSSNSKIENKVLDTNIKPIPMKILGLPKQMDESSQNGFQIRKHSILLIDNYEPNGQHDSIFDLNMSNSSDKKNSTQELPATVKVGQGNKGSPNLSIIDQFQSKNQNNEEIKEILTEINGKQADDQEDFYEIEMREKIDDYKDLQQLYKNEQNPKTKVTTDQYGKLQKLDKDFLSQKFPNRRSRQKNKACMSLARPSYSHQIVSKNSSLNIPKHNRSQMGRSKEAILSEEEVRRIEQILDCKNRAVNKWIEEKEDHYDKLMQKLYSKAEKRLKKYSNLDCDSANKSDNEESNRFSLKSSDTEQYNLNSKSDTEDSQNINSSLMKHLEKEFEDGMISDSVKKIYKSSNKVFPKPEVYVTHEVYASGKDKHEENPGLISLTKQPQSYSYNKKEPVIESGENDVPNISSNTSRIKPLSCKLKSKELQEKQIDADFMRQLCRNQKRSRGSILKSNLTDSKNTLNGEAISATVDCHNYSVSYESSGVREKSLNFTNTQIDALFFLVEEYSREYKIDPQVQAQTMIEFWKNEYSKTALYDKAFRGELNPAFVEDILSDSKPKCKKLQNNHYDILMLRTLAKMDENSVRQLYIKNKFKLTRKEYGY